MRRLLLTMFVLLSTLGYCADQIHRQSASVAAIERLGGQVAYGSSESDRLARWLGHNTVARVRSVFLGGCTIGDDDLACLADLPEIDRLVLTSTPISDAGLAHLCGLERLSFLDLRFTRVSSAGVERLRRCLPHAKIVYRSDID